MDIQLLIESLQSEWAIRALITSSLVGIMCGVLGCFIVLRNMALIGDALSHAILPGVAIAFLIVGYSAIGFFMGAVFAGLLTAIGITWLQQNVTTKSDATIGIVYTVMFALGVMIISGISREGVHLDLKDFLFGSVLGISNEDIYLTAFITFYVLASITVFYRYLFVSTFQPVIAETMGISVKVLHYFLMLLLSVAVVASLRSVGVILVVAMLVTTASTALLLSDRLTRVLVISALVGLFSAVSGMIMAIILDTVPGPAMAVMATACYILAVIFSPKKGLISRYFKRQQLNTKIRTEDILKQSYRLQQKGILSMENLLSRLSFDRHSLQKLLRKMTREELVVQQAGGFQLTDRGKQEAQRLVRAHRLWETYLVQEIGLTEEQIHEEAEKYEHLLTEDILDEVDMTLGYPTTDPHGSPIPVKFGLPNLSLFSMKTSEQGFITLRQQNEQVRARMWELGLLPEASIEVIDRSNEGLTVQQDGKKMMIPSDLARQIQVETNTEIQK